MTSIPSILFIDAYDSFSNNIIALLQTQLKVSVTKIPVDAEIANFPEFLAPFAAIVCGPGPGHPGNASDVGLYKEVWRLTACDALPVLGICLGFQSLILEFGGNVERLKQPRHGIETCITSRSTSILRGLLTVKAVQYHSLHGSLGHEAGDEALLWAPSKACPELLPLAWEFRPARGRKPDMQENPNQILMGVKHVHKPFFGIQFHPESICSEPNAQMVMSNWWGSAVRWLKRNKVDRLTMPKSLNRFGLLDSSCVREANGHLDRSSVCSSSSSLISATTSASSFSSPPPSPHHVNIHTMSLGGLTVPIICKALDICNGEVVVLDSEQRQLESLGVSSIIGIIEPGTRKLTYSVGATDAVWNDQGCKTLVDLENYDGNIFTYIKAFMHEREISNPSDVAFHGGLIGYISYEACLETIGLGSETHSDRPDICFAFIERSIVVDHKRGVIHIQSIADESTEEKDTWLAEVSKILEQAAPGRDREDRSLQSSPDNLPCSVPAEGVYKAKIGQCKEQIQAGNSYELCLTDQTIIHEKSDGDKHVSSWDRYLHLRLLNPAPFAAYIRLGPLTLLSTSPERFICWSRFEADSSATGHSQPEMVSMCQFRPIKGTLEKDQVISDGRLRRFDLEEATEMLAAQKERAENLMIVDLIRHDLNGVASPGNVNVKALMVVEEYQNVFQLVSVIEAKLIQPLPMLSSPSMPASWSMMTSKTKTAKTGIDVLASSLPPGSMTGAPKRKACELLREIEGHKPRSIYSGVVGYMCVSGKGDFSVVIRSAFKWDHVDKESKGKEEWNIGAGGAVTSLSTEDGEWEEMLTKLRSTLGAFAQKNEMP